MHVMGLQGEKIQKTVAEIFETFKTENFPKLLSDTMMVSFMCQLDWAPGCPFSPSLWGMSVTAVLNEVNI